MTRQSNSGEALRVTPAPMRPHRLGPALSDADGRRLQRRRDEGRAALMPYMMAGYPDRETSLAVAAAYAEPALI